MMKVKVIKNNSITLAKLKYLINKLNDIDKKRFYLMTYNYQKNFLLGRYLLDKSGIDISKIYYNTNGKPLIKDKYFSISHTSTMTILVIHDKNIGIDIEEVRKIDPRVKNFLLQNINFDKNINKNKDDFLLKEFVKREAYIKFMGLSLKNLNDDIKGFKFKTFNIDNCIVSICYL